MKWRCQAPGRSKTIYRHYTDCTDQHVVCTPDTQQPQQQGQVMPSRNELVVFLPGTGGLVDLPGTARPIEPSALDLVN